MKTVRMNRDYLYRPKRNVVVQYLGGTVYPRVPEAAVRAIVGAGAGQIVDHDRATVAGDVSQGTIDRLEKAVITARQRIDGQARVLTSGGSQP